MVGIDGSLSGGVGNPAGEPGARRQRNSCGVTLRYTPAGGGGQLPQPADGSDQRPYHAELLRVRRRVH
ncbi:MAG: hypothetical protein KIS77_00415 [Saprospiraceae bacterium]|nr:hypothetical protein [Saprospiraceae bacterium]